MRSLVHLILKEWLVLLHDWHALLLLFAMPVLFILVMSLALRDQFAAHKGVAITYHLRNDDTHQAALEVEQKIREDEHFRFEASAASEVELLERVGRDAVHFLVVIPSGFGAALLDDAPVAVRVTSGPAVEPAVELLFEAAVRGAVTDVFTAARIARIERSLPEGANDAGSLSIEREDVDALVERRAADASAPERPSAVQQNVPAWLLFAMFFIAIPLSTTWVQERQQGTFARLRAMGVTRSRMLLGKLVPYFAINLLQVGSMLCVGVYLVPLCGGDALTLGQSPAALVVMALAVSFASVSYALLIANVVTTSEQATIFTGVSNLLLAVLGGIMVPRFVMPQAMQAIGSWSPMAWGLEGFLDIFLRRGGVDEVGGEAVWLGAFGIACLLGAALFMGRRRAK
ncbi:MAG: ABC transporter permease [Planctomycetes bacterium]|nr:ABC transporter permease [Planctomycetota bacterium]